MGKSGMEKPDINIYDEEGRIADPDYARDIAANSNELYRRRGPFGILPPDQKKIQRWEEAAEKSVLNLGVKVAKERIPDVVLQQLEGKFKSLPIDIFTITYHKRLRSGETEYWIEGYRRIRSSPPACVTYKISLNEDGSLGREYFSDLSGYEGQPEPAEEN
jgi:hypothetical protein